MARRDKLKKAKRPSWLSRWWSGMEPERKRRFKLRAACTIAALVVIAIAAIGMKVLEANVLASRQAVAVKAVRVQFVARPVWMPRRLLREIAEAIAPQGAFHDSATTADVFERTEANPWVRSVRRVEVRPTDDRHVGALVIEAEFRQPIARVMSGGREFFFDAEGIRLPGSKVPRYVATVPAGNGKPARQICYINARDVPADLRGLRIHYHLIDGVRSQPPRAGEKWKADDLADALKLVRLIRKRPWADRITVIDVHNHHRRVGDDEKDPEIFMIAQVGRSRPTKIKFGRFPGDDGDWIVWPARKMSHVEQYMREHNGRLAGLHRFIDLRYDNLHVSVD